MNAWTPHTLWQARLDALERDLNRVDLLFEQEALRKEGDLAGRFGLLLSSVYSDLGEIKERQGQPAELWSDVSRLTRSARRVLKAQLEWLGGLAISQGLGDGRDGFDEGFSLRAKKWLNDLCLRAGLEKSLSVVPGRGPLLEEDLGIVRLPFLDWDLWHLPLLARGVGLLAAAPGSPYRKHLDAVVGPIVDDVIELLQRAPSDPPGDLMRLLPEVSAVWQAYRFTTTETERSDFKSRHRDHLGSLGEKQEAYLHHLFADMFTTAVTGPVYPIAVFVLDLDYLAPDRFAPQDPDLIENREQAPRFLPPPSHRAAAMVATLELMNEEDHRPSYEAGPYAAIATRLRQIWSDVIRSHGLTDRLEATLEALEPWHRALYREVIRRGFSSRLPQTARTWSSARAWRDALSGAARIRATDRPDVTVAASAAWLHRLDHPDQANHVAILAEELLRGETRLAPLKGAESPVPRTVAQARLERLQDRLHRLEMLLKSRSIADEDRAAVAGRFYRLLSEQAYHLGRTQTGLRLDSVPVSLWGKLADLAMRGRPVEREALEFIGGLLVHYAGLDLERDETGEAGASICDLADALLRNYARRTGVNWSARTVLGDDPFLATATEVIRIRFPDWSLWNLPLMAHEFGHLVALATPAFQELKQSVDPSELEGPLPAEARRRHLDEFFSDVFATYSMGPAFACDALLLQFNPAEAFDVRGVHPTHDERVRVILHTLRTMNEDARAGAYDPGAYAPLLDTLQRAWDEALDACGRQPDNDHGKQLKQALKWASRLYGIVEKFYRLGARYSPERWEFARETAQRLVRPPIPDPAELEDSARSAGLPEFSLTDLLNALWWARAAALQDSSYLNSVANVLGRAYMNASQGVLYE